VSGVFHREEGKEVAGLKWCPTEKSGEGKKNVLLPRPGEEEGVVDR